jgi:hypothetical protein
MSPMKDTAQLHIASLNVVSHPHTPEGYIDLLVNTHKRSIENSVKIEGKKNGFLTMPNIEKTPGGVPIGCDGKIITYDGIITGATLYNLIKEEVASDDLKKKISIPQGLGQNMRVIYYYFDAKKHHMVYTSKYRNTSMSPMTAAKFLKEAILLANPGVDVEVTPEPDKREIQDALELPTITKVVISLSIPNSDSLTGDVDAYIKDLQIQGVIRETKELTGAKDKGLHLSALTKQQAMLAQSNGYTTVSGINQDGQPVNVDSASKTHVEVVQYETKSGFLAQFIDIAKRYL